MIILVLCLSFITIVASMPQMIGVVDMAPMHHHPPMRGGRYYSTYYVNSYPDPRENRGAYFSGYPQPPFRTAPTSRNKECHNQSPQMGPFWPDMGSNFPSNVNSDGKTPNNPLNTDKIFGETFNDGFPGDDSSKSSEEAIREDISHMMKMMNKYRVPKGIQDLDEYMNTVKSGPGKDDPETKRLIQDMKKLVSFLKSLPVLKLENEEDDQENDTKVPE